MASWIRHRGPDGFGIASHRRAVLAAHRLAIVDVANGRQPAANERGTVSVVLNGEIYNHAALRAELRRAGHAFRSLSDTEVCAHLYEHCGPSFVTKLEGQFALALWDEERGRAVVARDHVGICPLFYAVVQDTLYFASEIKALLGAGVLQPELDPVGLAQAACFAAPHAPRTMFNGIHALPPGTMGSFDGNGLTLERYWDVAYPKLDERRRPSSLVSSASELSSIFADAVRRAIPSEVDAGVFISGGIDSSMVAHGAARASSRTVGAFTIASPHRQFDESAGASISAASAELGLTTLTADDALIARSFADLVWHAEVPLLSTEAAAIMSLARVAKTSVKVILTGEGADEAFAGYVGFHQHRIFRHVQNLQGAALRDGVRSVFLERSGLGFMLPPGPRLAEIRSALGCVPAQTYEYEFYRSVVPLVFTREWSATILTSGDWGTLGIEREKLAGRHWLDQSSYVGYKTLLAQYLLAAHGDRALLANGVEARYPFLDRRLVEFAAKLAPSHKLGLRNEKLVLRRAATGSIPERIALARKKRFMTPFGSPFVGPEASDLVSTVLGERMLREYGYFEPRNVRAVIEALRAPRERAASGIAAHMLALRLGIALTLVVSLQLFHYLFLTGAGFGARHPRAPAT